MVRGRGGGVQLVRICTVHQKNYSSYLLTVMFDDYNGVDDGDDDDGSGQYDLLLLLLIAMIITMIFMVFMMIVIISINFIISNHHHLHHHHDLQCLHDHFNGVYNILLVVTDGWMDR